MMKKIKTIYNIFTKNMEIQKYINMSLIKKVIIWIILFVIMFYTWIFLYSYMFESDKLAIDRYNFWQLGKVKIILSKQNDIKVFFSIKDFNDIYKSDIKTIKNCYYITSVNWDKPYIFWFQLESLIYKFIYFWKNYAYPSYSIPTERFCLGVWVNNGRCFYTSKQPFIDTISNPCE